MKRELRGKSSARRSRHEHMEIAAMAWLTHSPCLFQFWVKKGFLGEVGGSTGCFPLASLTWWLTVSNWVIHYLS